MTKLHIIAGPAIYQSFDLKVLITHAGRSHDNDIQIKDQTVSRKHLKIARRGNRYFITDLKSRNGTFYNGDYIAPGLELEAKEGVPIAIGISLICLGEGCREQMMPFLDTIGFTNETSEQSGIFLIHRDKTNQKKLELIYRVSEVLTENLPINKTLEKILEYIMDLLKKINRVAFILVDPETEKILDVISRSNKPGADTSTLYCEDVVRRVVEEEKSFVISNVDAGKGDEILDTLKTMKIISVMCAPLIGSSQIMGVIYVDSQERPFGFGKEDLSLFMDVCQRTALAIENARFAFINSDSR